MPFVSETRIKHKKTKTKNHDFIRGCQHATCRQGLAEANFWICRQQLKWRFRKINREKMLRTFWSTGNANTKHLEYSWRQSPVQSGRDCVPMSVISSANKVKPFHQSNKRYVIRWRIFSACVSLLYRFVRGLCYLSKYNKQTNKEQTSSQSKSKPKFKK